MNTNPTETKSPEIRVFISSTFRDMQLEREYLIKHVFPELRHICRERGVEFTEIDLRWGVTKEEAEQGKVLKICLDEIERCRPYFIGILGERYGWTPRFEDVSKDQELVAAYPWIEQCIADGISVTEMEILYGVLNNPSMREQAFFYFRDANTTPDEFKESDQDPIEKLISVKDRVRGSKYPVRENFASPEELGAWVRRDLIAVVDELYPAEEAPTPLEREHRLHEAFALTRRRAYVARTEYLEALDAHAQSETGPLAVVGESGSGKSSLLAFWVERYRQANPNAFIIQHYVGATSSGGGHIAVMRRIMEEIRHRYNLEEPLPATPDTLEREFPAWLAKVQREPLILVFDALNQLTDSSSALRWMPRRFPPNIRVFLSTVEGETLDAVRRNSWPELHLNLLSQAERDQLIQHYLGQFRKALSQEQRDRITSDAKSANPLFLRTVLEELRVFGSFEGLDDRIEYYVTARDVGDLFQRLLARMEEDYSRTVVQEVMTMIWASRRGLAESEILEITGLSRIDLSTFLLALEYQFMHRDGLLDFYHNFLRAAVEERYLSPSASASASASPSLSNLTSSGSPLPPGEGRGGEGSALLHLRIADYFQHRPTTARKADELPWQLQQAGATERLERCIADIPLFMEFTQGDKQYELIGYWLAAGGLARMEEAYSSSIAAYEGRITSPELRARALGALGDFLMKSGRYQAAEEPLRRALEFSEEVHGSISQQTSERLYHLAELLFHRAEYDVAESLMQRSLQTRHDLYGDHHEETTRGLNQLGKLYQMKGEYDRAEPYYRQGLATRQGLLGATHKLVGTAMNLLAFTLNGQGKYGEAEPLYRESIRVLEGTLGRGHMWTVDAIYNLGMLLQQSQRNEEAEELLREALAARQQIFGDEHPDTGMALNALAILLRHTHRYEEAEPLYREALAVWNGLLGAEHPYTAISMYNLAEVLQDRKNYTTAEQMYAEARQTFEKVLGGEHPLNGHAWFGLGTLYRDMNEPERSAQAFQQALQVRRKALGDHPETVQTMEAFVPVLRAIGKNNDAEALEAEIKTMKEKLG
ncbi:MAG: tetratricopeptide repeat protein [Armatimonadetes bacterium]|nr:tetratricopeptide repeat protein [Armatimonadota bacterium]